MRKPIIVWEQEFQRNSEHYIKLVSEGQQVKVLSPDGKKIRSTIGAGRRFFFDPEDLDDID